MKCPKCNKEIDEVIVVSLCSQTAPLVEGTNEIAEYNNLNVESTLYIQCPECYKRITRYIKET